jgi:catechol 2,3-dioxygenase-like lactoylglutathione lyase family enzyme
MADETVPPTAHSPVNVAGVVPILRVSDFDASVAYYVNNLGFRLDWASGRFGSVSRGKASVMLCEGSQGCPGTWMWFAVSDADALLDELGERGARIRHPPQNFPWGSRELHVFDPDGHVLRFASEAPEDAPLGQWLDEDGVRWQAHPDGRWTKVE